MDDSHLGDPDRLQALARSEMLDSGTEEVFDRLARLATRLLGTPIALMTVLDEHHQHVKGSIGLDLLPPRMPAAASFCQYVVRNRAPFTVTDARDEPRASHASTQAAAAAGVLTYCGVPLADSDGLAIGALCAMDTSPRVWTEDEVQVLDELAASAMSEVRLRVANHRLRNQRRLEAELGRLEGQLRRLADHDGLTGLFNRRRFEAELTCAVKGTDHGARVGALLLIDLDGFKHVNDTLGHSYGDELITRVAAGLRRCLCESDVIGRLGGDEFAVILPRADAVAASTTAEKVLHTVAEHGTVRSGDRRISVTASIGVAALTPGAGVDAEALLVAADAAMYTAKRLGRNQIAFAAHGDGGPRTLAVERSWLARLRTALDHDRLELFAQPIRAICGPPVDRFELLLRMHGEAGELISPAAFLPNAERFDLIQEIDRWVFAQALTLLANCHAAGRDVSLGVNMSGRTLCDPCLIGDLTAMIAACPIPRDRLIVEITETAAIVNIDRARDVAQALRALGFRFALDDFGSGFASLSYLKHLQFDFVKIDGEFVRGLAVDGADRLIVASVVGLAHRLGAETIAEFIEDEATVTRLRRLGVDHGQGYHLGRPAPVTEVLPEGQSPARSLTIESSRSATSATIRSPAASSASL